MSNGPFKKGDLVIVINSYQALEGLKGVVIDDGELSMWDDGWVYAVDFKDHLPGPYLSQEDYDLIDVLEIPEEEMHTHDPRMSGDSPYNWLYDCNGKLAEWSGRVFAAKEIAIARDPEFIKDDNYKDLFE